MMTGTLSRASLVVTILSLFPADGLVAQGSSAAGRRDHDTTFSTTVDMVALNVTVTDKRQKFVGNLTKNDFVVLEEGVTQQVTVFDPGSVPIDLAVLIDMSGSIRSQFEIVRRAALQLLAGLGPADRGAVLGFNERVRTLVDWTGDQRELARGVAELRASGGTSLHTAIYVALKDLPALVDRQGPPRRRALVVLSDGADTTSSLSFDDVLDACRRAGVGVYTIVARPAMRSFNPLMIERFKRPDLEHSMRKLAVETGARAFTLTDLSGLRDTYTTIGAELAHQYLVGYTPTRAAGPDATFRRVVVSLRDRTDLVVRTRPGYVPEVPVRAALTVR
jgi:Ca-activated chloride channel family protein